MVREVIKGVKPSKPASALSLGLSDEVWKLLEGCWETEGKRRPLAKDVLVCVEAAASICGTLPPVGGLVPLQEEPHTDVSKFGMPPPSAVSRCKTHKITQITFSPHQRPPVSFECLLRTCEAPTLLVDGDDPDTHSDRILEPSSSCPTDRNNIVPVKKEINTGPSIGVDHVVSLLRVESGSRELPNLTRSKAKEYANILDAVRYFMVRVMSLI